MKCYDCREQGQQTEAIGVCQGCGRAVCQEHGQLRRWPLLERVAQGMGYQYRRSRRQRTVLLCAECWELSAENLFRPSEIGI
jgi:hypothetical protein